jgi:hypothetical protein
MGYSFKLHFNKERVKKNGEVSLYLQVIVNRRKKDIALDVSWLMDKIDLDKAKLRPQFFLATKESFTHCNDAFEALT